MALVWYRYVPFKREFENVNNSCQGMKQSVDLYTSLLKSLTIVWQSVLIKKKVFKLKTESNCDFYI